MANAIRTISQGIVDAAIFFNNNSVAFNGAYPTKEWGEGVGSAISAFSPVIKNLDSGGVFGLFSGGLTPEKMSKAITTISQAIVDSSIIFNGASFGSYPTKEWSEGVGKAISTFSPVIKQLDDGGLFSLFTGGFQPEDMSTAIVSISEAISTSSILLSLGKYTIIPIDYMKNLRHNVSEYMKLIGSLGASDAISGSINLISSYFLGSAVSGIARIASDYDRLAKSISNLSGAIQGLDLEKITALKTFTGSIVLMSLMDTAQFELMMNTLESKAKVFVDVINDISKGTSGTSVSVRPTASGGESEGLSLSDVIHIMNRMDAKLARIASSSDNVSTYVDQIRSHKPSVKTKK